MKEQGTIRDVTKYRPWGEPAWCELHLTTVPAATTTVTINGIVFTADTEFAVTGQDLWAIGSSLVRAINSDPFAQSQTNYRHGFRNFYATLFGGKQSLPWVIIYGTGLGALTVSTTTGWVKTDNAAAPATGTSAPSITADPYAWTTANDSVTTSATGTNRVALASHVAKEVTFNNNSGTDVEFRRGATGAAFVLTDGQAKTFRLSANTSELDIRRVDTSNTQITLVYEYAT